MSGSLKKKNTEKEESSGQDLMRHQNQKGTQCETWHRGLTTNIQSDENRKRKYRGKNCLERIHMAADRRRRIYQMK